VGSGLDSPILESIALSSLTPAEWTLRDYLLGRSFLSPSNGSQPAQVVEGGGVLPMGQGYFLKTLGFPEPILDFQAAQPFSNLNFEARLQRTVVGRCVTTRRRSN